MRDVLIRSIGRGVFLISSFGDHGLGEFDTLFVRGALSQLGDVMEVWADPESAGALYVAVMRAGHPSSRYEERIADEEVAGPVRRAAESSRPDSEIRFRLGLVDEDCEKVVGGGGAYVKKFEGL